jgi:hypothetical protein
MKEHKREIEIWDRTPKLAVKHKTTGYGERRWKQEPPRRAVCRLAALHVHGFCAVATVISCERCSCADKQHWQRTLACLIARGPGTARKPENNKTLPGGPGNAAPVQPNGSNDTVYGARWGTVE